MSDIGVYLNVIDNEEADRILRLFKISVITDNLDAKKTLIRNKIKPKTKSKISPESRLRRHLMSYKINSLENLSEKEFIIFMNKMVWLEDYKKIANCIFFHPDIIKKYKKDLSENKTSGKNLFDLNFEFSSNDEIENYISKISLLNNKSKLSDTLDVFIELAVHKQIIQIDENEIKQMSKLNLVNFYNQLEYSELYEIEQYLYFKNNNKQCDEIYNEVIMDAVVDLLMKFSNNINKNEKVILIEKELNELNLELQNTKMNIKEIEKENNKLKKENTKLTKEINNINIEMDKKSKLLCNKSKEVAKIKSEIELAYSEVSAMQQEYEKEKKSKYVFEKEINDIKNYYKYYLDDELEFNKPIFAVIHSGKVELCKKIFKEVLFIDFKEWQKKIEGNECIYIQREGISNTEVIKIKKYCEENKIKCDIFSVRNEKDLIQKISVAKNK